MERVNQSRICETTRFRKKKLVKLNCGDVFLGFATTMEAADNRHRGYCDRPPRVRVRFRGYVVEIKNWREGENLYKDVKGSEEEAAMVHDLARLCSDPPVEEQRLRLNIEMIARRISGDLLHVGKNFLIEFLERHPVAVAGATAKERADAVMKAVVKLAPVALQELKEDIIKRFKVQIACMKMEHADQLKAKDDQIAALAAQKEYDDFNVALLQEIIDNGECKFGLSFFDL